MFHQYRSYYPQGSLISELVTVEYGRYVVRAIARVEGATLATSLAAADTVEQAEDNARSRLLALLGVGDALPQQPPAPVTAAPPIAESPPVTAAPPIAESPPVTIAPPIAESPPVTAAPPIAQPEPAPEPELWREHPPLPSPAPLLQDVPPEPEEKFSLKEEFPPLEVEAVPPAPAEPILERDVAPPAPEKEPSPAAAPSKTKAKAQASATPPDFSDIIVQTNLELKRLGWTNEQGRVYLLETYGKRSRQLLTDEELVEFLDYLQSQPGP